ncbi:MAG: vWA domain-containing protein, partial [Minisyncoccia bacterium]
DTSASMNTTAKGSKSYPGVFSNPIAEASRDVVETQRTLDRHLQGLGTRITRGIKTRAEYLERSLEEAKEREAKAIAAIKAYQESGENGIKLNPSRGEGSRLILATRIAVALTDALSKFPEVKLSISAYSSPWFDESKGHDYYWGSTHPEEYKESSHHPLKRFRDRLTPEVRQRILDWLLNGRGGMSTEITPTLRAMVKEFKSVQANRKLLFILSDGDVPDPNKENAELIKKLRALDVRIVLLPIGASRQAAVRMLKGYIPLEDISEEVTDDNIGKILGEQIQRMLK